MRVQPLRASKELTLRNPAVQASILLLACACGGNGDRSEGGAADDGLTSAARLQVAATAQPASAKAGDEVDIAMILTSTRDIVVDVALAVTKPDGSSGYSASMPAQSLTANIALKRVEASWFA